MARAENAVCRVEVLPPGREPVFGTGFLIAPNIVITNYHVIEQVQQGTVKPIDIQLRFDFALLDDGVTPDPGTVYKLDVNEWLLDYSPYSDLDKEIYPAEDQPPDKLDYALLRVAGSPGDEPVGGSSNLAEKAKPRGYLSMQYTAYDFPSNNAMFILQHPAGGALKLALDTDAIIGCNGNHTRVRYRTNTDGGSSGAPCFNDSWELVALHHAGDPNYTSLYHPQYNQGIPIAAILTYLEKRNNRSLLP